MNNSQGFLLCKNNVFLGGALSMGNSFAILMAGRPVIVFDKERFAELLEKAKGNRSIRQYGQHCGVDAGYISRLLRRLLDQPPSADVIRRLASRAYAGVTVEELLAAAGYLDEPRQPSEPDLPQTVAPYLPEGFHELPEEAKKEVYAIIDYVMQKYKKKDGDDS
jgi:transcriptional regulator with XRE-family HTH domain